MGGSRPAIISAKDRVEVVDELIVDRLLSAREIDSLSEVDRLASDSTLPFRRKFRNRARDEFLVAPAEAEESTGGYA